MDSPRVVVINSEMARIHDDKIREMLCDYAEVIVTDNVDDRKHVNVGTIGHVDCGKSTLSKAIAQAVCGDDGIRRNKSDRKRNRANRWR